MDPKRTRPIAFGISACMLLAGSIAFGRQQGRELTGIRGLPIEGHDIVAGVEVNGTKQLDVRRLRERLRSNGAELKLGLPLEAQTLCRFKEVLRDVMGEKGFPDAEITHDTTPMYGNPRHLCVRFTVIEGRRSGRTAPAAPLPSPAQRCSR